MVKGRCREGNARAARLGEEIIYGRVQGPHLDQICHRRTRTVTWTSECGYTVRDSLFSLTRLVSLCSACRRHNRLAAPLDPDYYSGLCARSGTAGRKLRDGNVVCTGSNVQCPENTELKRSGTLVQAAPAEPRLSTPRLFSRFSLSPSPARGQPNPGEAETRSINAQIYADPPQSWRRFNNIKLPPLRLQSEPAAAVSVQ